MEYVTIQGIELPKMGLGTWRLTGDACRDVVRTALELGYRHIDTAQMYDNEGQVGRGIQEADVGRDEVFLTTKLDRGNLRRDAVLESTEESLRRLDTDYVDLLLIHHPSRSVPVEETIAAMNELVDGGAVRHIGVSNFDVDQVRAAMAASDAPILTNQVQFHTRRPQRGLLAFCQAEDVILTAYSPLAHGGAVNDRALRSIGQEYGKTPAQVALRWVIQHDNVVTIPKASSRPHLEENLDVFDFALTPEEMEQLTRPSRLRTWLQFGRGFLGI